MHVELEVDRIDKVFVAHFHLGPRGENGQVVVDLYGPTDAQGAEKGLLSCRTITKADLKGPLAGQPFSALIEAMEDGLIYVNVHTTDYPAGEIRGQVRAVGRR